MVPRARELFLEGLAMLIQFPEECAFHRSVMLRDVLDRTRTTLAWSTSDKPCFNGSSLEARSVIFANRVVTGDR